MIPPTTKKLTPTEREERDRILISQGAFFGTEEERRKQQLRAKERSDRGRIERLMTTDWGREILRSPKYSEELERLGYTIPKEYQTVRGGLMIDRNEMRIRLYDTVSDGWDDPQDVSLDSLSDLIGDRRPRSDQIEISKEILRSIAWNQDPDTFEPEKKGKIVEMPTGAGKTVTAMITIRWLIRYQPKSKIGFMVHRRELFAQTFREFKEVFGSGMINITAGSRNTNKRGGRIRLFMEQTLASKWERRNPRSQFESDREFVDPVDVLFVDEAHSMNYQSFLWFFEFHNTKLIGLTATPDDHRLNRFWERKKIVGASQSDLEEMGVLVEPTFYTSAPIDLIASDPDPSTGKKRLHFDNAKNHIIEEMRRVENDAGRPIRWIVKTQKKRQAIDLASLLNENGFPSRPFYSGGGGGSKAEMDRILDGDSGGIRVAVVVQRFSVGYDHPGIEGVVLTGSMKYSLFVQTVGRSLRPGYPRVKDTAYIVDLAGNLVEHRTKYLERRTSPKKNIPLPPEPRKEKGIGVGPRMPADFEPESIFLHKIKLSHIDRRAKEMTDSVLLSYCAVQAEEETGRGDLFRTARAKKTGQIYWLLTKRSSGGAKSMKDRILNDPESRVVWKYRLPMPASLKTELNERRLDYARNKRVHMAIRNSEFRPVQRVI